MNASMHRFAALLFVTTVGLTACAGERSDPPPVPDDPTLVRPLIVGLQAPAFEAQRPDRSTYRFRPDALDKPLIITFYRGGWCPYCTRQLMRYRDVEAELVALGYELLFISPDKPETSARHLQGADFDFTLLSDSTMRIARAFGLAFRLDDATVRRYLEEYDIDIERDSGQTHHYLPVPATYIVGTDGVIDFMYANVDHRTRLDPELLRKAAQLAVSESRP